MMDSATDEFSPHLRSSLTPLIVTNTISVSSLSYSQSLCAPPEALALGPGVCPSACAICGGAPCQHLAARSWGREVGMEAGSGPWALQGGLHLADAFVAV